MIKEENAANTPIEFEASTDGKKQKKAKDKMPTELTDEQVKQLADGLDPKDAFQLMKFLRNMPRKKRRYFMKVNKMPKLLAGYISKEHSDVLTKQMQSNIIPITHPKLKKYATKGA